MTKELVSLRKLSLLNSWKKSSRILKTTIIRELEKLRTSINLVKLVRPRVSNLQMTIRNQAEH